MIKYFTIYVPEKNSQRHFDWVVDLYNIKSKLQNSNHEGTLRATGLYQIW